MINNLYLIKIDEFKRDLHFSEIYSMCSSERRLKIDNIRNERTKWESALSGCLINYSINKSFNININDINFHRNEYGKLYLDNNYFLNISHSDNYIICYTSEVENGCDVERIHTVNKNIASRFYNKNEIEYLDKLNNEEKIIAFFRIWTAKESYSKCLGVGLSKPLDSYIVELPYKIGDVFKIEDVYLKEYSFDKDYSCTLATYDPNIFPINIINVNYNDLIKV